MAVEQRSNSILHPSSSQSHLQSAGTVFPGLSCVSNSQCWGPLSPMAFLLQVNLSPGIAVWHSLKSFWWLTENIRNASYTSTHLTPPAPYTSHFRGKKECQSWRTKSARKCWPLAMTWLLATMRSQQLITSMSSEQDQATPHSSMDGAELTRPHP